MLPQERVLRAEGFLDAPGVLPAPQPSPPAPSPSPAGAQRGGSASRARCHNTGQQGAVNAAPAAECLGFCLAAHPPLLLRPLPDVGSQDAPRLFLDIPHLLPATATFVARSGFLPCPATLRF